jgi:hypothetical protein
MNIDVEMVQPGWTVVDANGEELGKVVDVEGSTIKVKKGGFLGGELSVPRTVVTEVETGRLELGVAKSDLT